MGANDLDLLSSFDWRRPDTPLSSIYAPIGGAIVYLVLIFAIRSVAHGKPAWTNLEWNGKMQLIQSYHNVFLALLSLMMLLGTAMAMKDRIVTEGYDWIFCEKLATKPIGKLFGWSYIYYLSKYYELLDTILQLLKGKDPPHFFLHSFHHVVVLFMSYFWVDQVQSLQFPGLLFNTFVHVMMYSYYFLRANGYNPWWKSWVTRIQIIQFATSFVLLMVTLFKFVVPGRACAGLEALGFNAAFNAILLFLFFGVLRSSRRTSLKKTLEGNSERHAEAKVPSPSKSRGRRVTRKSSD